MPQSFFIWNNSDCRAKGVRLQGPVPIVRPEERVQHVTIPGRPGELTLLEGDGIYQSYIQTASIQVTNGYRVREIANWLKGSGYVTFHGEPDRRQKAWIIGAVTLDRHSRNMDVWEGEVQFYCDPLKEKLIPEETEITTGGDTVTNRGDVPEKPLMEVTASGTTVAVTFGGKTITLTGATSGRQYFIDCESMMVWHVASSETVVDTQISSGDFPELETGDNAITGSGWSKIVFTRRERYL